MAILKERTFICLVLAALLILCATIARPALPMNDMDRSGQDESVFWSRKKYEFKNANVVAVGSSCTYKGISPDDMGRYLSSDLTILNFGFSASPLNPFIFARADEVLAKEKGAFKAILLEISPIVFHDSAKHYKSIKRCDSNYQLKKVIEPLNVGLLKTFFEERKVHEYRHCYPNGWMATDNDPPSPTSPLARIHNKSLKKRQMVHKYAGLCLDQVRKWRQRGILVFGYKPYTPCMKYWDINYDFDSRAYHKLFEQAGGMWLDVDRQDLFCYDGVHLDSKSARTFSQRLGKAMAERLRELGLTKYAK